jgi:predicted metal-dependent hydrolase
MPSTAPVAPTPIRPRPAPVRFDEPIPAHWFGGIAVATHLVNGVNLLFPAGERFFVRSVRHYLDALSDPTLREQVKGFFAQEGRHAGAHERFFEVMEAQGYEIRPFLARYERLAYGLIEPRVSPETRLSVTVALEHFTAIMAENALRERFIDHAHPSLRALLYWHASEEIEHKSVAFDVLAKVDPSYALRMKGLALATLGLAGFWVAALIMLLRQDHAKGERGALKQWQGVPRGPSISRKVFLRGIREYIRRDFHPSQLDNTRLAEEYLASAGLGLASAEA